MKKSITILLLFIISLYIQGCSAKYSVLVDARTSQEYELQKNINDKYKIIFDKEEGNVNFDYELVYKEVVNVFQKNGYQTVDDISDAKYSVFINFKVGGPHSETISHSVPITGQVGVNTHTGYRYGPYGMTSYTYTTPRYGTVGYRNYETVELFYTHSLSVVAYEFSMVDAKITKKAWQLICVTSNESNDFRKNLPALLLVLEKHMATDTHGNTRIEIYEKQGQLVSKEDFFKPKEKIGE